MTSMWLTFTDLLGNVYSLTDPIDFNTIQLSEIKRMKCKIKNVNDQTNGVHITAVAHPTAQAGSPDYTYLACLFALLETDPFVPDLTIGNMSPLQEVEFWIQWTMPTTALPGYAQFAVKAEGVTDI